MTLRTPAVLFLGDLVILARNWRLVTDARARGLAPVVVTGPDTDPDRLAARMADPRHVLSGLAEAVPVPDPGLGRVGSIVAQLRQRYAFRGVVSAGEVFAEPAGVLADTLGLPGPGATAARVCRDKLLQRLLLDDLSPRWCAVSPEQRDPARRHAVDPAAVRLPAVVKPTGRMYSAGVVRVDTVDELRAALSGYGPEETVLVEDLVHGPEYSVEALCAAGRPFWFGVTGKSTNEQDGRYFTEMSHTCPAGDLSTADHDMLVAAHREVLRRLAFADGVTHAEYRLTEQGPVLMEVAARVPGDAITRLWELATGEPMEPRLLDLATGTPTGYPEPVRRASQVYLPHTSGVLHDVSAPVPVSWVSGDDFWPPLQPGAPSAPARCVAVVCTRQPGDVLGPLTDSRDRAVSVLVDGPLSDELGDPTGASATGVVVEVAGAEDHSTAARVSSSSSRLTSGRW